MKVGVTGGNGFIGSCLVEHLLSESSEVACLARKTSNLRWIDSLPVEFEYGDVRDPDSLEDFVREKEIIFHLAGLVKGTPEELDGANAEGTRHLLETVKRYNPKIRRFVYVSSQEAVGLFNGSEPWNEDIPVDPATNYGKSKVRGEEICKAYMQEIPVTVIRPCPVYGPKDTETFIFFKMVAKGRAIVPNPNTRVSVIFSENLAKGIYQAAVSENSRGKTYFLADDDVITWQRLNGLIAEALGKKPKELRIPKFVLYSAAGVSEFFNSLAGKSSTLNRDKVSMLIHPNLVVSNELAKKDFGYRQLIPLERAVKITADWYKEQGWI